MNRCKHLPIGRAAALPLAALTLLTGIGSAEVHAQTTSSTVPGWQFSIAPYVWAPSIDGALRYTLPQGTGGATQANVGIDSFNILEALNFAAMIGAEARNGRYSLLTDFIYLDLGNSGSKVQSVDFVQVGRNPVSSSLNAGTETSVRGSLFTLAGGYTLAEGGWGQMDAIGGARLFALTARTDVRLATDVTGPGAGLSFARSGQLNRSTTLVDGIVGLRGHVELGGGFHLPYSADVGTGSSRVTWQAAAAIGYRASWADVSLGYRHVAYVQGGNALVQDFSFSGPLLAMKFTF